MKKTILLLCVTGGILCHAYAQVGNTAYGGAGTSVGNYNSFFGYGTAQLFLGGDHNTAIGARAHVSGGSENTTVGSNSLNKGGYGCTAVGFYALNQNRKLFWDFETDDAGYNNTGIGYRALESNKYGDYNTAVGSNALFSNEANANAAFGYYALYTNTSGYQNTAVGIRSLFANASGYRNTAIGGYSLNSNLNGYYNTASGYYASYNNNMGNYNTSNGYRALYNNTTGNYNTAQGAFSLEATIGGNYNSALGYNAGPTADLLNNTTAIGYLAVPTASNQVRLGNNSVTSIGGQVSWTTFSDGRFKKDIREDVSGLDFINELKPVSYTVDQVSLNKFLHINDSSSKLADAKSIPVRQTGFVAQEVEALVKKTGYIFYGVDAPENENDPYGIRYSEFVVPLVKAVQELSAEVREQRQQIQSLLAQLDVKDEGADNTQAVLLQNNPNPFDAETAIKMTLPENVGIAAIMIYNLEGKQMKNIHVANRGNVMVKISASELAAGMYLYSLIADGKVVDTKRMVLTK